MSFYVSWQSKEKSASMRVCVYIHIQVPTEARREYQIPWGWSYRQCEPPHVGAGYCTQSPPPEQLVLLTAECQSPFPLRLSKCPLCIPSLT